MDQPNVNPILELQAAMSAANGRLGALENIQKMMLQAQREMLNETTALRGIFSSLETHLVMLFEERAIIRDLVKRVEALERRPPTV